MKGKNPTLPEQLHGPKFTLLVVCGFLPDLLWSISVMTFILVGGWKGLTRLKGHYHTSKDSPRLIWNNTSESKDTKSLLLTYIVKRTGGHHIF
jgi:hypothetical protein